MNKWIKINKVLKVEVKVQMRVCKTLESLPKMNKELLLLPDLTLSWLSGAHQSTSQSISLLV